jgi:phosphatidylserine/phosphatidylglycerophosphate/cardiolipin synthase-like enzyme
LEHAKRLAVLAAQLDGPDYDIAPIRLLVQLLLSARSFVHLMSTGLSQEMLGVLRTIGELVSVAAIFSSIDKNTANELGELQRDGVPIEAFVAGTRPSSDDLPHTKLIVVDGVIAIAGSVNFTAKAWRKAANRMENVEVVTDLPKIVRLNNNYFAHHWGRLNCSFAGSGNGAWRFDTNNQDLELRGADESGEAESGPASIATES